MTDRIRLPPAGGAPERGRARPGAAAPGPEGGAPGLAAGARRFGVPLDGFPTLLAVEAACAELPAFRAAEPERQPDAPPGAVSR